MEKKGKVATAVKPAKVFLKKAPALPKHFLILVRHGERLDN